MSTHGVSFQQIFVLFYSTEGQLINNEEYLLINIKKIYIYNILVLKNSCFCCVDLQVKTSC